KITLNTKVKTIFLLLQKMLCNNFYLKLKTFLFQLQKIIVLNSLICLQELVDLDWLCKMLVENAFLQVNGTMMHKKHTEKILVKFHLVTLQKSEIKIIFLKNLTFYVQVFLAKHSQLLAIRKDLQTQEELCFLTLNKL